MDTVEGNSGGDEGLIKGGVVSASSGEVTVQSKPYLYTIEIDAENPNNRDERARFPSFISTEHAQALWFLIILSLFLSCSSEKPADTAKGKPVKPKDISISGKMRPRLLSGKSNIRWKSFLLMPRAVLYCP